MVETLLKLARHGLVLVACCALMCISCSRDVPYAPLEKDQSPQTSIVGGTIRDMGQKPVADAVVTLEPAQNGLSATAKWMLQHPGATSESVPGRRVTVTSQSGRYAFDKVAGGEYVLHVLADNHLGAARTVTVPQIAQADTIIVNVNLTPTGDFTGKAFLEGAASHANTIVYVEGTSYVAVTNPAAGYTIHGVPVGSYKVRAAHPGYLDDTRDSTITTAGEVVALADMTLLIDQNIAPTAMASAPSLSCELDPVMLSGSGSSDADGSIVLYAWDFEDDGTVDYTNAGPSASHSYPPGAHRAKLRVTDNKGAIGLAVVTFTVVQAETVFVASTGNDANPGTRSLPKQTITAGIAAAVADTVGVCPATVVVAGDHVESPTFVPDMRVRGGYDAVTWTRTADNYSVVDVQGTPALADNINGPASSTTISGFDFQAANGQGGAPTQRNSIAMRVVASSALKLEDCRFVSGSGFAGPNGVSGTLGGNGNAGFGSGGGSGGTPGGLAGGSGGGSGAAGITGGGGCGIGGVGGANTGCSTPWTVGDGGPGLDGCAGIHGTNGALQSAYGTAGVQWTPLGGFDGLSGTSGGGGGGGGGGGAFFLDGNPNCQGVPGGSGGGGGGGGGSATGGTGGGGGGASFAVYLYNSSPLFTGCRFTAGNGGTGGAGGNGGSGGTGGAGAFGSTIASTGGKGGHGGAGGHGGGGSGGPGGPCYCVYRAGSSNPVLTGSVFVIGSGGLGGAAGVRADNVPAAAGLNGPAGTIGP